MPLENRLTAAVGLIAALATACEGSVLGSLDGAGPGGPGAGGGSLGSGGGDPGGGRGSVTFECDPQAAPSVTPLRRLSRLQYENTLHALFDRGALDGIVAASDAQFAQLPADGENSSVFSGNDARVTQRHVDAFYGITDAIARAATEDAGRLAELVGDCALEEPPSEDCVTAFITEFGRQVFRRPLTSAEQGRYFELYDAAQPGVEVFRGILFQFLMSPSFLYHFEVEGSVASDDASRLALTPFELASRLSFHFWQTMPDSALLDAAESGALATDAGYAEQVERLFADPRTQQTIQKFWAEWYQLEGFGGFAATPAFAAFSDGIDTDLDLHGEMVTEIRDLVDHFTWQSEGRYRDVLTSNLVFTRSSRVASLYGVEAWDGGASQPSFPAGQHAGLLARAAMLVEGNELTNPIKRGAFVLRSILCTDLHPPANLPAEALTLPEADPNLSTRQRFEAKTSPTSCAGCHATFNPFGFLLESFDALGRFRTEEQIFDDSGELLSTVPIDPAVEMLIGDDDMKKPASTAAEFGELLASSPATEECFARHYFRYTYRRDEGHGDSCTLKAIRDSGGEAGSLRGQLRSIALDPAFRERVVGAQ